MEQMKEVRHLAQNWMEIARWSPSGGNAQPWLISADESEKKFP